MDAFPPSTDKPPLTRGAPQWLARLESPPSESACEALSNPWPDFLAGQADRPVRVLLIDEDAGARRVIAHELTRDARVCVAGEAGSMLEGKRLLMHCQFDVLILDVRLGGGKGFDLIQCARQHRSSAEIIVHTTLEDEAHVHRAFAAGASGYLVKNSWFQNFTQAVLQVVNGGAAVSPSVVRHLLIRFKRLGHSGAERGSEPPKAVLSAREREVLQLVAKGHVTRNIAAQLSISVQTVSAHMKSICRKLQVRTRAHAVIAAASLGLM
ncbi:LuxR C-terminal-related transcriptional regulator [Variovorax sp. VaC1]|uniref:LuxR C-terminal-related transcriptional regulator n=1 Tax=Variovorax sp. VaC1 TaxID=3373132 RepID=UPI003747D909